MSAGALRVGVIGAGLISNQYLTNLTRFPDLEVMCVADLDTERAAAQAQKFGVPHSGTVDELLAHDDIELVVNLTIPAAHVEVGLRILDSGKHVWAEKPFALDREGGMRLLARADELGLRIASAPDTFLGPGLQNVQRLIAAGAIGTPLTALALFQHPGPESWHPNPEFYFAPGGGPLFDMGPYYLTALVQQFGPVARVAATASTARTTRVVGSGARAGTEFPVTVPTHHSALLQFEGGASAQAVFSFESRMERQGVVEIAGSEATIAAPDPNGFGGDARIWDGTDREGRVESPGEARYGRGAGVLELARAIRAGVAERASGRQAYHVLDVMVSITEAAASGRLVDVESTVERPAPLSEDWDPFAATL